MSRWLANVASALESLDTSVSDVIDNTNLEDLKNNSIANLQELGKSASGVNPSQQSLAIDAEAEQNQQQQRLQDEEDFRLMLEREREMEAASEKLRQHQLKEQRLCDQQQQQQPQQQQQQPEDDEGVLFPDASETRAKKVGYY